MKMFLGSLLFTLFSFTGAYGAEINPAHNRENVILVSGTGVLEVKPDIATIHMSVVTRAKVAQDAQTENAVQSKKLIDSLREAYDFDEDDIKTTSYTVTAEYNRAQPPVLVGYVVRHSIAVTVKSLDKLGEVLDTAISSGADFVDYIQYGLTDQKKHQLKALKLAMDDAYAKAQAIAESVGRNVMRVIRVSQEQYYFESDKQESEQEDQPGTEILPGDIRITATLNVEYLF